jgi:Flp pilus assembly protein TadD
VQNPAGRSLGALWHDWDNDGWLDLYVANDVSDNVYFRNVRGRFEDISHGAWVADYRSAMGLATGDFDRDGDDDLHVTHWVAQENALYENLWAHFNATKPPSGAPSPPIAPPAPPPGATNKVYPLRFVDIADQKGLGHVALPLVGWGTEFVDLDHDGWLDLLVVNGNTLEADGPPPKTLKPQEAFLFWNERGRHFHNLAPLHPGLSRPHVSRGLGCAVYDGDGDMDLLIADLYEGVRLYRNDMAAGNWLKLRLRSKNAKGKVNGFGDGSTVIAWVGDTPLRRSVTGVSYLSQHSHVLHWGLGTAPRVDRLEIRWHAGGTNLVAGVEANAVYEIAEGHTALRRVSSPGMTNLTQGAAPDESPPASSNPLPASGIRDPASRPTPDDRQRLLEFWQTQRAAMDAMKLEQDNAKAIVRFREAIALNPQHEDSRYYLGLCLASQGDTDGALAALAELQQLNPQSHRAWQQWGVLRTLAARNDADLVAAEQALQRAHTINPEETGALLVLGEVALLRGDLGLADERLAAATHTNPKAVGGFFLRGYLAWKRGDHARARPYLEQTRTALGPDWQPKGATSEGDVSQKQHVEKTPLTPFWDGWKGQADPAVAFALLETKLHAIP